MQVSNKQQRLIVECEEEIEQIEKDIRKKKPDTPLTLAAWFVAFGASTMSIHSTSIANVILALFLILFAIALTVSYINEWSYYIKTKNTRLESNDRLNYLQKRLSALKKGEVIA